MKPEKSLIKIEISITVLQIAIFIFFAILQFAPFGVLNNMPIFFDCLCFRRYLQIDSNISGIFLQVDATILTLTIALVALISGLLSDSHMGISYSDYFLNIRPKLYKQIVIIIFSFFYFFIGCVCFWLQKNYLVVAVLFCEILLVLMSSLSIYGIFGGKDKIRKDIEKFSIKIQLSQMRKLSLNKCKGRYKKTDDNKKSNISNGNKRRKKHNKTIDAQNKFIDAFSKILAKGDKNEFEEYLNVFLNITDSVWKNRNNDDSPYDWETYEKKCCTLLDVCADSSEHQSKILYLKLVEAIYDCLFLLVKEERGTLKHTASCRHRFGIVEFYSFCNDIIRKISITEFESSIKLSTLIYKMNVIDLVLFGDYIGEDNNNENNGERWIPNSSITSIQSVMGQYIVEQQVKGNLPNISYWAEIFNSWHGIENINYLDENDRNSLSEAVANGGVLYACGMIIHSQFSIIKEGLYERRLSSIIDFKYYEARAILSIHGYLYYMAWREDEKAVGIELKKKVRSFLEDSDVMQVYREFITQQDIVDDVLIDNIRSEWRYKNKNKCEYFKDNKDSRKHDDKSRLINVLIRGFDLRMGGRGIHRLIMSEVIDDFCLFTIVFLYYHGLSNLKWIGDEYHNIDDYISYISSGNDVEKRIRDFVEFMNSDILKDEKMDSDKHKKYVYQSNEMYEMLQITVKEKYKAKRLKEAREKEAEYLRNHDMIEEKRIGWIKDIYQDIKKRFGSMLHDYVPSADSTVQFFEYKLFNYTTYTNMIDDKFDNTDLERIATRVVDVFVSLMKNQGCVIYKNRKRDFKDDQDYANYLVKENLDVMIGSKLLLQNSDYMMTETFEDATKDCTWISTYGGFYAAAIQKGSVILYIRNLDANIREVTLDDEYMDTTLDDYEYEPILNVSIPFARDELSDFLKNERKRVEVTAEIGIQVYDFNAGIYFESERKPIVY